ncbi:MAG: 4-amino-4-deoxy-L-arabinose-phosphoundecaprenol flippase subunit ArnE [Herbaspirillum frisingense]|uniref:4-amino-4-deoxy-L-arabinose-phosphoundecaprenol flippase subunit ArnE n=1 Tax=Herbaspirillum frisingense TaxID=92645 RepID=A0A7V8FW39_9BURK|nr:MAG: 4-amino-4-deoxy-L-arabinose-phosphoundecaprenol flippase subunit ArnE [Herbaspirillum frisingense]
MNISTGLRAPGVKAALLAALLFGAATPLAKPLLVHDSPWMIAALLYLGSGAGLFIYRRVTNAPEVTLPRTEAVWFAGAVLSGGVVAPVLLMLGLKAAPASSASLLLNAEGVLTALLAWFVFKENVDRRIALGMAAIVAGALMLAWPEGRRHAPLWSTLAILGACLAWGVDNNLTRRISLNDGAWIASVKGLAAGSTNLVLAWCAGAALPGLPVIAGAALLGFLAYGVSLTLFVLGLRHLGTARTGAYFATAPFLGALIALAGGEHVTGQLLVAGFLMGTGIWLHLTEAHSHEHAHEEIEHEHEHTHDDPHHIHHHDEAIAPGTKHSHRHRHARLKHTHAHFPDTHHQHRH